MVIEPELLRRTGRPAQDEACLADAGQLLERLFNVNGAGATDHSAAADGPMLRHLGRAF